MRNGRESSNPVSGSKHGRLSAFIFLFLFVNAILTLLVWSYFSTGADSWMGWFSRVFSAGFCAPSRALLSFIASCWRLYLAVNVVTLLFFLLSGTHGNFVGVTQGSAHWAEGEELKIFAKRGTNMPLADGVYLTPEAKAANKNVFVLASPGGGKTFTVIIPAIEAHTREGGSFFCTDTKGALYRDTAKMVRERGYRVYLINLSDPWYSHRYNPLLNVHKERRVTEISKLALSYTKNVRDEEAGIGDSIWEETFKQLITAVWLYQYDFDVNPVTGEPESRAMWRTAELIKELRADDDGGIDLGCEFARIVEAIRASDPLHPTVAGFDFVAAGAKETVASVIFTAGGKLQIFSYPEIEAMTRDNDVPIDRIFEGKTAVYLNFEVGSPYKAIAALFMEQLFAAAYYVAETKHGGTWPKPFKIYLDELPNLCRIHSLPERLSTSRSYNVDILVSVQSMQQLRRTFKDAEKTLMNNCVVHVYLGSGEADALKEISEALGKTTTQEISHSRARGLAGNGGNSDSDRAHGRELALPSELYSMPGRYAIVKIQNHPPIFAEKFHTERQGFYKLLGGQGNPNNSCVITKDFEELKLLGESEYEVEHRERTERIKKRRRSE